MKYEATSGLFALIEFEQSYGVSVRLGAMLPGVYCVTAHSHQAKRKYSLILAVSQYKCYASFHSLAMSLSRSLDINVWLDSERLNLHSQFMLRPDWVRRVQIASCHGVKYAFEC